MNDPREAYGLTVHDELLGTFRLRPSRHITSETGGTLDFGLEGCTTDGRRVIFGELFAAGIGEGNEKIRLNTKLIGERLVSLLNQAGALVNPTSEKPLDAF